MLMGFSQRNVSITYNKLEGRVSLRSYKKLLEASSSIMEFLSTVFSFPACLEKVTKKGTMLEAWQLLSWQFFFYVH